MVRLLYFLGITGKTVVKQGKIAVSKTVDEFFEGDNEETEFNFQINLDPSEEEKYLLQLLEKKRQSAVRKRQSKLLVQLKMEFSSLI